MERNMTTLKHESMDEKYEEVAGAISTLKRHGLNINLNEALKNQLDPHILFDGDDGLFKKLVPQASHYFEYGCGKSTEWTYHNTDAQIRSVDTSQEWALKTQRVSEGKKGDRLQIKWVDVGAVGNWGTPVSYQNRENFTEYTDWFWSMSDKPDLVVVDGRFRVCCFLTSVKHAEVGTPILFDDYAHRTLYHIVEEFLPVLDRCGRQALFEVSKDAKKQITDDLIEHFRYVID